MRTVNQRSDKKFFKTKKIRKLEKHKQEENYLLKLKQEDEKAYNAYLKLKSDTKSYIKNYKLYKKLDERKKKSEIRKLRKEKVQK